MKITKNVTLPPDPIFKLKMHKNAFGAGILPQTPLGELTALHQTP